MTKSKKTLADSPAPPEVEAESKVEAKVEQAPAVKLEEL